MKILIAGSRGITDYIGFKKRVDSLLKNIDKTNLTIVEGGARGVDAMARRYAEEQNIPYIEVLADWEKEGKSAGYKRNVKMAGMVTHAIIFWDGKSPGTKHMINIATEYGITIRKVVIPLDNGKQQEN